jgi:hypothetical protein
MIRVTCWKTKLCQPKFYLVASLYPLPLISLVSNLGPAERPPEPDFKSTPHPLPAANRDLRKFRFLLESVRTPSFLNIPRLLPRSQQTERALRLSSRLFFFSFVSSGCPVFWTFDCYCCHYRTVWFESEMVEWSVAVREICVARHSFYVAWWFENGSNF